MGGQLLSIGSPRASQKDEVEKLHALSKSFCYQSIESILCTHPANDWDPTKTFLQSYIDIPVNAMRAQEVSEAPGIPPISIYL